SEMAGKDYSEETAQVIDREVSGLLRRAYQNIKQLLQTHQTVLENLAMALLKYETLEADEVRRILKGETILKTTVKDLIDNVAQTVGNAEPVAKPANAAEQS